VGVNMANAISRQYRYLPAVYPVLLPAAGTLSISIKENYRSAVNHRLVTDLPLVISGWLKVDRRSGTRIIVTKYLKAEINPEFHRTHHSFGSLFPKTLQ